MREMLSNFERPGEEIEVTLEAAAIKRQQLDGSEGFFHFGNFRAYFRQRG